MRMIHRFIAWLGGYFWLPCDACGAEFGGHEFQFAVPSVVVVKRESDGEHAYVVCPKCQARALRENLPVNSFGAIVLEPMHYGTRL